VIISYKYKFIFLRPRKVGGTSVHLALSFQSGEYDTISKLYNMKNEPRNEGCEKYYRRLCSRSNLVEGAHNDVETIRRRFGVYYFDKYKKISIVRNPWECHFSRFLYVKSFDDIKCYRKIIGGDFDFCKKEFKKYTDERIIAKDMHSIDKYCFLEDKFILDFTLMFHNLENDYRKMCRYIGIKYIKLPRAKCYIRPINMHYHRYYDDELISVVLNHNRKTIDHFNYKFGDGSI